MNRSVVVCLAALMILPACSTVAGVGKDVSALGRGVTHVADEVRDEVFTPRNQPRYVETRYQSTRASQPNVIGREACDPYGAELRGGSGLPPCPEIDYRR